MSYCGSDSIAAPIPFPFSACKRSVVDEEVDRFSSHQIVTAGRAPSRRRLDAGGRTMEEVISNYPSHPTQPVTGDPTPSDADADPTPDLFTFPRGSVGGWVVARAAGIDAASSSTLQVVNPPFVISTVIPNFTCLLCAEAGDEVSNSNQGWRYCEECHKNLRHYEDCSCDKCILAKGSNFNFSGHSRSEQ